MFNITAWECPHIHTHAHKHCIHIHSITSYSKKVTRKIENVCITFKVGESNDDMIGSRLDVNYFTSAVLLKVQRNIVRANVSRSTTHKDAASPRYLLDENHLTLEWSTDDQSSQCSVVCSATQQVITAIFTHTLPNVTHVTHVHQRLDILQVQ